MKKVLVLGAGHVAKPLVEYLMQHDFHVIVASRTMSKAQKIVGNNPNGEAKSATVDNKGLIFKLINETDITVSLLPPPFHPMIARMCVDAAKSLVTTSYVSKDMQSLDEPAKKAGIILLNELGLDPGIDHMSAMRIIHGVQNAGGRIVSFHSYCGALPSPMANNNPFGYKFSWAPRGLLLDSKNSARYLENGEEVRVSGDYLFEHYSIKYINGFGYLEHYPNRDSMPYIEKYGIKGTGTMYRGTLRYVGWCETMKRLVDLGLINDEKKNLKGMTYRDFFADVIGYNKGNIVEKLANYLHIDTYSTVMKRLLWLGILDKKPIPMESGSELDVLEDLMLKKLKYEEGEMDMDIMQHEFIAEYPDKKEKIISTLVDFGIPGGDTSIARTVGLPAAIGTRLVLEGKINLIGVHIPVLPVIYEPVLNELENLGIKFKERVERVK